VTTESSVVLTDDLNGLAADETVLFGLDGFNYSIDLSSDNAAEFRRVLTLYAEKGTKFGKSVRKPRAAGATNSADRVLVQKIRAWAQSQGIEVAARGRLSKDLVGRYNGAQKAEESAQAVTEEPAEIVLYA
jgi:hypothetical protein